MIGEAGMVVFNHQIIWELDGMFWGNLPGGLEVPFDGMPMEFEDTSGMVYDQHYMLQQQ